MVEGGKPSARNYEGRGKSEKGVCHGMMNPELLSGAMKQDSGMGALGKQD